MIGPINRDRILGNFVKHNKWRKNECLNLIASECTLSPLASRMLDSDMEGRYSEHKDSNLNYEGTEYTYEIEEICNEIIRKKFITRFADVRPTSGSLANLIIFNALLKSGDVIMSVSPKDGGHFSNTREGMAGVRSIKDVSFPFNETDMNIDYEKTIEVIKRAKPGMVVFGSSNFLFPHPVKEIREEFRDLKILYDSAHVFGFVYNGAFQNPFEEGADLLTSSTNKTFQGPQGGVIVGNYKLDNEDWKKIQKSIYPGVMGSTRPSRFHALAITAMEMDQFGDVYADKTVKNAQALGRQMFDRGFRVLCPHKQFTKSHQILVDVSQYGGGDLVAREMARANVICNKTALPWDDANTAKYRPSGIRIGVQELTRIGMKENDMQDVAEFFKRVIMDKEPIERVKLDVKEKKESFSKILFCYNPIKAIRELEEMLGK